MLKSSFSWSNEEKKVIDSIAIFADAKDMPGIRCGAETNGSA